MKEIIWSCLDWKVVCLTWLCGEIASEGYLSQVVNGEKNSYVGYGKYYQKDSRSSVDT